MELQPGKPGIHLLNSCSSPQPSSGFATAWKPWVGISPPHHSPSTLSGLVRNRKSLKMMDVKMEKWIKVQVWGPSWKESWGILRKAPCAKFHFSWSYPSPRHISGASQEEVHGILSISKTKEIQADVPCVFTCRHDAKAVVMLLNLHPKTAQLVKHWWKPSKKEKAHTHKKIIILAAVKLGFARSWALFCVLYTQYLTLTTIYKVHNFIIPNLQGKNHKEAEERATLLTLGSMLSCVVTPSQKIDPVNCGFL